jgi:phosphopantothenoylcysteine decarboxylase/phosphopantothenate--cysteine ligase
VLANRSSGKQGFALAQAALDRGARVILVSAPTGLLTPVGAERVNVGTAAEMTKAVIGACADADGLLMAAAVADYRPRHAQLQKIKKAAGALQLELEPTDDILQQVAKQRPTVVVGFAAESEQLESNARAKLEAKDLDLIVANDITDPQAGFSSDTNRVTIIGRDGVAENLPLMSKTEVAEAVIERVAQLLT